MPEMKTAFFKQALERETNSPEHSSALIRREVQRNIKLTPAAAMKLA